MNCYCAHASGGLCGDSSVFVGAVNSPGDAFIRSKLCAPMWDDTAGACQCSNNVAIFIEATGITGGVSAFRIAVGCHEVVEKPLGDQKGL